MVEIAGEDCVELPIVDAGCQDLDGNSLYILLDGHHTQEAARELGLEIRYVERDNEYGAVGDELLETCYIDSDYYYIASGITVW